MGADFKRREARKRKFGTQANIEKIEKPSAEGELSQQEDAVEEEPRKKQKRGPAADLAQAPSENNALTGKDAETITSPITAAEKEQHEVAEISTETKSQRFIVFIGNLPFTATDDSITKHFAKVHPRSIRHRTDRTTGKSKGFAFLEFDAYDRMKTCLKVYHHSTFDDGLSPARKINVELTVGGGGAKSKDRKAKLQMKNVKLTEERQRRAKEDERNAKTKEAEGNTKGAKRPKRPSNVGGETSDQKAEPELVELHGDIHPSRRDRMLVK